LNLFRAYNGEEIDNNTVREMRMAPKKGEETVRRGIDGWG
jgi:hypothetical protein